MICVPLKKTIMKSQFQLSPIQTLSWGTTEQCFFLESLITRLAHILYPSSLEISPLCTVYRHSGKSSTRLNKAITTQPVHVAAPSTCFPSCPTPAQIRSECPSLSSPGTQKCSLTLYLLATPFPYV